jgi:4-hydroxythreonine-4-phosphate dehydrogenase
MGYPLGIGPEVILKALASPEIKRLAYFLIIGNEKIFKKECEKNKLHINYSRVEKPAHFEFSKQGILFLDASGESSFSRNCRGDFCDYGRQSIDYIDKAVKLILSHKADILITGPIDKHAAGISGFKYTGHTEFLARLSKVKKYGMMLVSGRLKIALATAHIAVKDISRNLNRAVIYDKLILMDSYLRTYLKMKNPIIAVCGLNPHAGDNGLIGDEEKKIIIPAVKAAAGKGVNVRGPFAADGLFNRLLEGAYDAALCMYHDQGLVALKMIGRNEAVNITMGLPFVRTSPGHGTAIDIAGKGIANPESMKHAIKKAVEIYRGFKA